MFLNHLLEQNVYQDVTSILKKGSLELSQETSLILIHNQKIVSWLRGELNLDLALLDLPFHKAYLILERDIEFTFAYSKNQFGFCGTYKLKLVFPIQFFESFIHEIETISYDDLRKKINFFIVSKLSLNLNDLKISNNEEMMEPAKRKKLEESILEELKMRFLVEYGVQFISFTISDVKEKRFKEVYPKQPIKNDNDLIMW